MRTHHFYAQNGMPANFSNRNVITRRTAVGPAQYQPECVQLVFTYRRECPRFFLQIGILSEDAVDPVQYQPECVHVVFTYRTECPHFFKSECYYKTACGWPSPVSTGMRTICSSVQDEMPAFFLQIRPSINNNA